MAARALVLVLAILIGGFGVIALRDRDACEDAAVTLFEAAAQKKPVSVAMVDSYADACRGSRPLAAVARAMATAGLLDHAVRLAHEAIRREPSNYEGWAALTLALRGRGHDIAADRALREARRLNPRFGREPG